MYCLHLFHTDAASFSMTNLERVDTLIHTTSATTMGMVSGACAEGAASFLAPGRLYLSCDLAVPFLLTTRSLVWATTRRTIACPIGRLTTN